MGERTWLFGEAFGKVLQAAFDAAQGAFVAHGGFLAAAQRAQMCFNGGDRRMKRLVLGLPLSQMGFEIRQTARDLVERRGRPVTPASRSCPGASAPPEAPVDGIAAVVVVEIVGIQAHVLGLFVDDGIEPLPEGHTGAPGGILRRFPRVDIDPFDAPGNGFVHLESMGSMPVSRPIRGTPAKK